jgi:alkylation response protein AidB-like acyl-CoA dehydrogenase
MPYDYQAPLRDMRFVIERVLNAPQSWAASEAFAELDIETTKAVLEEASRFAREVLLPVNASGDAQGCTRSADGSVRTPAGFVDAYAAFVDGGWPALPCSPEWGGQGLPLLLDAAVREMLDACNHAWNMYPDLLHGAYETIKAHGSEELKGRYLQDLATGRTLAAMALTEPGAGSDLGLMRSKAEPQPDGSWRLSGQKIFISGGEHDLTPNIVHLVLARTPDAPEGTRGISLFLVPKFLPEGTRNTLVCEGIEHKMGIHGSATCSMRYEAATGWLVGQQHRGLAAMFLMMNSARLHVGLQGLGHLEMATQNALRYAQERDQGGGPIARHPAVRHILLRLQATAEALRCIAYRAALALDESVHHPDEQRRAEQAALAAWLTPIVKARCTAEGFDGASRALQVFGGYGYVGEYGIEQTVRDARIAMVYEGTNEIQAIDLVQRKLLADEGRALNVFLRDCEAEVSRLQRHASLAEFANALREQVSAAREGFEDLKSRSRQGREALLAVSEDAMAAMSHLAMAWAFAARARALVGGEAEPVGPVGPVGQTDQTDQTDQTEDAPLAGLARCRYGVQWLLPQAKVHWQALKGERALPGLCP